MIVFDKSNVHFMWDDSLLGRPCYHADSITDLMNIVIGQDEKDIGVVTGFGDIDEPFVIDMRDAYSIVYPTDVKNESIYNKDSLKVEWDRSLDGKKCLMANSIQEIQSMVLRNASPWSVYKTDCKEYPFTDIGEELYKFAYYDPYYDFRYALLNGEPIEYLAEDGFWWPLQNCIFNLPIHYYRFKYKATSYNETKESDVTQPETNMELLRWLAEGNGYVIDNVNNKVLTSILFEHHEKDNPFDKNRYSLLTWMEKKS